MKVKGKAFSDLETIVGKSAMFLSQDDQVVSIDKQQAEKLVLELKKFLEEQYEE